MVAKMQPVSDEQIRRSVLNEIDWEPEITSSDISVSAVRRRCFANRLCSQLRRKDGGRARRKAHLRRQSPRQ